MLTHPNDMTICFDVDETLIIWDICPEREDFLYINDGQRDIPVFPHRIHISQLIRHKKSGHFIIVWSQGGALWAQNVIKALKLEEFVDVACSKPDKYYDDLPCCAFLGSEKRIYYKDKKKP